MVDIIFLTSNYLPYLLAIVVPLFLYSKGYKSLAVLSLIALGLNFLIIGFLKDFFNISRPFNKGSTPSFPSAHTSSAFCEARFLKISNYLFVLGILMSIFIGIGRVITGFHTWLDVIVGGILGYLIAEITIRNMPNFKRIYEFIRFQWKW